MNETYKTFFTLINNYLFSGITFEVTSREQFICVLGSAFLCVLRVYFPFVFLKWLIKD